MDNNLQGGHGRPHHGSAQPSTRGGRPVRIEETRSPRGFAPRRAVVLGGLGVAGVPRAYRKRNKRTSPLDDATLVAKVMGEDIPEGTRSASAQRTPQAPYGNRSAQGGRGPRGAQQGRGNKKRGGEEIDIARFINKVVKVEEEVAYIPTHQFADFAFDERIKANVAKKGYILPTAIQDQAIPHALHGRDVIGLANTGEGKTAAFLLPLINKMLHHPKERLLVVAPTRELALQIDEEFVGFARGLHINSALLIGGVGMGMQIDRLRRVDCRVIIGTPGRLLDLLEQRVLVLAATHNFVLDEADRMLDMGFIPDIKRLLEHLPPDRQNLFFSATFPPDVEKLASAMLRDPVRISVKKRETSSNVEQDIIQVASREEKFHKLDELLRRPEMAKVLVFGRTKWGVEKLGRTLNRGGHAVVAIHGDKSQNQRQHALRSFKEGKAKVLVATDVAARGLDIPAVSHVINYDVPASYDDYVHRIGRTGRAGKKGVAYTFVGD